MQGSETRQVHYIDNVKLQVTEWRITWENMCTISYVNDWFITLKITNFCETPLFFFFFYNILINFLKSSIIWEMNYKCLHKSSLPLGWPAGRHNDLLFKGLAPRLFLPVVAPQGRDFVLHCATGVRSHLWNIRNIGHWWILQRHVMYTIMLYMNSGFVLWGIIYFWLFLSKSVCDLLIGK